MTKGRVASTLEGLSDKLRMSAQDLLMAAANDIYVHKAIPELTDFLVASLSAGTPLGIFFERGTYEEEPFAGSRVFSASVSHKCGVPMKRLLDTLYKYSQ